MTSKKRSRGHLRRHANKRLLFKGRRLRLEPLEDRTLLSGFHVAPLVQVSGDSPLAECHEQLGDLPETLNVEVEPWLTVNPTDPDNLVGAWIQDQARGHIAGVSFDGGKNWQSVVIPGLTVCSGGTDAQTSDPWLSFSPNGDLYAAALTFSPDGSSAIVVNQSTDGGLTWSAPTTIKEDMHGSFFNDKESITADPTDPNFAYVTWTRFGDNGGRTWFSRTTDGGQTWEPARRIFNGQGFDLTFAHQLLVLPDGTLVNIFGRDQWKNGVGGTNHYDSEIVLLRSTDKGETWEGPIKVGDLEALCDSLQARCYATDPDTGALIRAGDIPDVAVDPNNGNLYVAWPDARFDGYQHPSIALAMSTDGGLTWSEPIKVNQTPTDIASPNQQALHPSVHVNDDGIVAVTYYDFRNNTLGEEGVPTDYWFVYGDSGTDLADPANWNAELRLTDESFDLHDAFFLAAPGFRNGFFIGDYEGLASDGSDFLTLFIMPHEGDNNSVFFRRVRATGATLTGASEPSADESGTAGLAFAAPTATARDSNSVDVTESDALDSAAGQDAPVAIGEAVVPTTSQQSLSEGDDDSFADSVDRALADLEDGLLEDALPSVN